MLQLEQKARWLRPVDGALPAAVVQSPRKRKVFSQKPVRTFSVILQEYRETLARLESIEREMADWLNDPASDGLEAKSEA